MPASPATMVTVEHARSLILRGSKPLDVVEATVTPQGKLPAALASRPALARSLHARWSLPGHDTSIMDGFALRHADLETGRGLRVQGESAAGHPSQAGLQPGHAMPISTGAVLPDGADLVIPIEDCDYQGDEVSFSADAHARATPYRFVRRAGSDVEAGVELLTAGTALGPAELALLVASGHASLPIHRAPRVAILATGDELLPPGSQPGRGQLIETNTMMLRAMAIEAGAEIASVGRVGDTLEATREALSSAANADLLLTSGGISVGQHDHVAPALAELGFRMGFRKVRLRPGKPTTFGTLGSCRVLALPGNPASSYVAFELFARPLIRRLAGHRRIERPRVRLPLAEALRAEESRDHYLRVRIVEGKLHPLPTQLSGAMTSLAAAHALALLPGGSGTHEAGARVDTLLLHPDGGVA